MYAQGLEARGGVGAFFGSIESILIVRARLRALHDAIVVSVRQRLQVDPLLPLRRGSIQTQVNFHLLGRGRPHQELSLLIGRRPGRAQPPCRSFPIKWYGRIRQHFVSEWRHILTSYSGCGFVSVALPCSDASR
jgi:hypothetical protein